MLVKASFWPHAHGGPLGSGVHSLDEMSLWNGDAPVIGQKGVTYGLQRQSESTTVQRRSKLACFGDESDDEADRNAAVRAAQGVKRNDAKTRKMHAEALEVDASIYDYDSYVDTIQAEREASTRAKYEAEKQGPRYLYALMEAKKNREREQNIMYERRLAKERKAEDVIHGDKEQFVTGAYKRKLEEDKRWQQEQEAKDAADLRHNVDAVGMAGVVGVLANALNGDSAADPQSHDGNRVKGDAATAESGASEPVGPGEGIASGAVDAEGREEDHLEADLERRAELLLQQRMQGLDKYDRRRMEMAQALRAGRHGGGQASVEAVDAELASSSDTRRLPASEHAAPRVNDAREEGSTLRAASAADARGQSDDALTNAARAEQISAGKKPSREDTIAAARLRAAERKRARLERR